MPLPKTLHHHKAHRMHTRHHKVRRRTSLNTESIEKIEVKGAECKRRTVYGQRAAQTNAPAVADWRAWLASFQRLNSRSKNFLLRLSCSRVGGSARWALIADNMFSRLVCDLSLFFLSF